MTGWAPELRVQLAAHPFAYPVLRALGRARPVVRLPGLGVVVNSTELAREVLLDPETFASDGRTAAELWTPVYGPSMLFNMDGASHRAMRRKLTDFFAPGYASRLCQDLLDEPVGRMSAALRRGERVDMVDSTCLMAGALANALIGFPVTGSEPEREAGYRALVGQGTQIISMLNLAQPRPSPRQIAKARAIAEQIGAPASRAWAAGDDDTPVGRMRRLGLSEAETRGLASALLLASTETISTFIPRLVALLHDHQALAGVAEAFRAGDSAPLDAAITEALRVLTPVPIILRSAARPVTLGSVRVRAHDVVMISLTNAAKAHGGFDPQRERPPDLRRLWFGAGPHFCLGYPLAMAQTHAIVGAVLENAPIRVVSRRAARSVLFPKYQRLEVTRA
jgi:cytochrome P450